MKRAMKRWTLSLACLLGAIAVASGCASYPQVELDQAKQAIAQAQQAQAEKFAPAEYAQAQNRMVDAEQMAIRKDYKEARQAALDAAEAGARAVAAAEKNRKIFEENERRRIAEEERIRAEEEAQRKAEEEAALAEANLFEEEIPAGDAFASEFGGEFEAAASGQEGEEAPTEEAAEDVSFVAPEPEPEPPAPLQQTRSYFVERYDTLTSIAARSDVYGDASLWYLLYEANQDRIKDPDLLPRGELRVPVSPTPQDKQRARDRAAERATREGWSLWDGR